MPPRAQGASVVWLAARRIAGVAARGTIAGLAARAPIARTTALAALALALIVLPAGAARADTNRNEVWLGGEARALRSSSANALTDDNLGGTSFGVARDLGVTAGPLALWAVAGMTTGSASGTLFQTMSTQLDTLDLQAGVRARYALHRLILASAQLGLGAQRARVAIDDRAGPSASDHAWGRMAEARAALDLFALSRPPFGIGMRAELGYAMVQAIELSPRTGSGGDAVQLPAMEASLGRLDLSGATFALSLVGQF